MLSQPYLLRLLYLLCDKKTLKSTLFTKCPLYRSHYIQHQEKKEISEEEFWSSSIKYQLVILGLTFQPPGLPIDICGAMAQNIAITRQMESVQDDSSFF